MARKKRDLSSWIQAGKENLRRWKEENPEAAKLANLRHGVYSETIRNRYSNPSTAEGKSLQAIMQAIEKDIGKPFDARQSLLMSVIRSKIIVVMQVSKFLESTPDLINYEKGTVPAVVDRTFSAASTSLRSALKELYETGNEKNRNQKSYEELVAEMKKNKDE
jgi:hypothetical protein